MTARPRVGIYNRHWTTFGGGETQAFGVVDALSSAFDVTMLGPNQFDVDVARERLGARLDGVSFVQIDGHPASATMVSAGYDLFINHTFRSVEPSLAPRSIYFVMFPHRTDAEGLVAKSIRSFSRRRPASARIVTGVELVGAEVALVDAALVVAPGVQQVEVELHSEAPIDIEVAQASALPLRLPLEGRGTLALPIVDGYGVFALGNRTERPELATTPRVKALRADGRTINPNPRSLEQRLLPVGSLDFLRTYDAVSANSEYTQRWTREWWGVDSEVITPPVRMRSAGEKERLILSVGRFFGAEGGHSKRQLEMVRAFRTMCEAGLEGWRLVLIGGSSAAERDYAMSVRAAAEGLPIEIRFSAPGDVLDEHFRRAAIYWHAAGLGADLDRHPDQAEHFGIAPVEAMSAGAVPVVFDAAGPAAVVSDGVDGLKYRSIDGLVSHTQRLIDDPAYRQRLAEQAITRSADFDKTHFEAHVQRFVDDVMQRPGRTGR